MIPLYRDFNEEQIHRNLNRVRIHDILYGAISRKHGVIYTMAIRNKSPNDDDILLVKAELEKNTTTLKKFFARIGYPLIDGMDLWTGYDRIEGHDDKVRYYFAGWTKSIEAGMLIEA